MDLSWSLLPDSLYSINLAPSDCNLFYSLQNVLKEKQFLKKTMRNRWCKLLGVEFYLRGDNELLQVGKKNKKKCNPDFKNSFLNYPWLTIILLNQNLLMTQYIYIYIYIYKSLYIYIYIHIYIHIYMYIWRVGVDVCELIGLVSKVFANGPGDLGSIPGLVIPKTFKMVVDTSLLNT